MNFLNTSKQLRNMPAHCHKNFGEPHRGKVTKRATPGTSQRGNARTRKNTKMNFYASNPGQSPPFELFTSLRKASGVTGIAARAHSRFLRRNTMDGDASPSQLRHARWLAGDFSCGCGGAVVWMGST